MHVVLLGTAAGGGFPQWNCWCPTCTTARTSPQLARPRRQSSVAFSADGRRWFLGNASPDVREQIAALPSANTPPKNGVRYVPIEGIVLTDAELDHTLGIALLREGRSLQVAAPPPVLETLMEDSRVIPVTQAFAEVSLIRLEPGIATPLPYRDGKESGLTVEVFPVAGDPPRFARHQSPGQTVGALLRDTKSGGAVAFVPGCGALDAKLLDRLATADLVLFDGTFWTDDELIALGISDKAARDIGHLPVSGASGSLLQLSKLPSRTKVYTHINNTNPMLVEGSEERKQVEGAGLTVGMDGMAFEV